MSPQNSQILTLETLFQRMQGYEQQLSSFNQLYEELQASKVEITRLQAQNAALQEKLEALTATRTTQNPTRTTQQNSGSQQEIDAEQNSSAPTSDPATTWAHLVTQNRPPRVSRPVRKVAAALRAFQPVDPAAPTGFGYLYLPRSRQMSRADIRRRLRTIGIDTSRVLDICFPARGKMGLLVHAQYVQTVTDIFSAGKVPVDMTLNPQDPQYLEDPKYKDLSVADRGAIAIEVHANRCLSALRRLRLDMIRAVGRSFVDQGWIDEDMVTEVVQEVEATKSAYKKRKGSPTSAADAFAGFRDSQDAAEQVGSPSVSDIVLGDTQMSDVALLSELSASALAGSSQ